MRRLLRGHEGPLVTTLSVVSALFALTGCSSRAADGDDASGAIESSEYDPDYLVFDSHDAAAAWFADFQRFVALQGTQVGALIGPGDERVHRVEAIVGLHWKSFTRLYGREIPPPRVLLFEADKPNAFIAFDPVREKIADAVLVQTPILAMSDEALTATLAHELGHLVFKHTNEKYAAAVTRYYRAGAVEPLGALQPNDPPLQKVLEPWLEDISMAGAYVVPELHGIPVSAFQSGLQAYLLGYLQRHADFSRPACLEVRNELAQASGALVASVRSWDLKWAPTKEALAAMDESTRALPQALHDCLPADDEPLVSSVASVLGLPREKIEKSIPADDMEAIRGLPTLDAALLLSRRSQDRVLAVRQAPDFSAYRTYSTEEQADDIAMTILVDEGKDPLVMKDVALTFVPNDADRAACQAIVTSHGVPNYGIEDAHHSSCYRVYHCGVVAEKLRSGWAGVTRDQMPKLPADAPTGAGKSLKPPITD